MSSQKTLRISIGVIAVLYTVGVFGLLSPWKAFFISATPATLLMSAALLIVNHRHPTLHFYFFALLCFSVGLGVEYLGVNHQLIFGNYQYGKTLGLKLWNVPLLIGVNWFTTMYAIAATLYTRLSRGVFVLISAFAATCLDWVMEPVAVALDFWNWRGGVIPVSNYVGWFCVSAVLFYSYTFFDLREKNRFAVWFLVIELLFFAALNLAFKF
ncbi:MAG: carotenoid biosynthesis protein [Flammeovirgaceae bacterium]